METIRFMDKEYVLPRADPVPARFNPAAARRQSDRALQPGVLSQGLASGTSALAATSQALDQVSRGIKPDAALKQWRSALPEKAAPVAKGGALAAVTEELDAAMQPLLQGAGGIMSEAVRRQREAEDQTAAVGWLNQGARLAAKAPPGLAQRTAEALGVALKDPGLGKLFQDKVAYYQVRRTLERDPAHELAGDPRLSGVAPEVLEDLEADRQRLAEERAVATAAAASAQRRDFGRALRQGHTDVTAGIAGPAYSREDFVRLYGAEEADKRLAAWQAAQAKAPAYAVVRGKSPAEIATAKAGYAGDRSVLDAIEAADAAERQRDPAGYALRWSPGVKDSLARAAHEGQTDEELAQLRADELWEAQAALGIAEAQRSPWTLEESQAVARRWLAAEAQPAGLARSEALVAMLDDLVLRLPVEQRAGALRTMERQGLDDATPGRLRTMFFTMEQGALAPAYRAADGSVDFFGAGKPPLVQLADSGEIASDIDTDDALAERKTESPALPPEVLAEDPELPAWLDANRRSAGESELEWSRRVSNSFDAADTPLRRQALYDQILEEIGVPAYGITWPVHGEDDAEALMRVQGLQDDAWLRAEPAPEAAQRAWEAYPPEEQWDRLWGSSSESLLYFVGPDGRLYAKDHALNSDSVIFGLLKDAEVHLARDAWSESAKTGGILSYIAQQPDFIVAIASGGAIAARGRGRGARLGGLHNERSIFASDDDYQTYRTIKDTGVPLGFASKAEVKATAAAATAALKAGGIHDGQLAIRGSAITGRKYNKTTGRYDGPAFDKGPKPSDLDYAVVSPQLYRQVLLARPDRGMPGSRTKVLTAEDLDAMGQTDLATWLRRQGRDANIMVYGSSRAMKARGPFLWMR